MEYILKARLVDNPATVGNKEDKILLPGNPENATLTDIYRLMKTEDAGLYQETICHVTNLFQRVFARLVLSGYQINTGLFYATPRFKDAIKQGKWNPEKSSIHVSLGQGKQLPGTIAKIGVHILGERQQSLATHHPAPANLIKRIYELKVTTQYTGGDKVLKTPRLLRKFVTVSDKEGEDPKSPPSYNIQFCTDRLHRREKRPKN
ncbi:DNA-binding domain-containing protein, partial [Bacteroides hominis]|nr:hypothetical protein [Bacteroides fragilis]